MHHPLRNRRLTEGTMPQPGLKNGARAVTLVLFVVLASNVPAAAQQQPPAPAGPARPTNSSTKPAQDSPAAKAKGKAKTDGKTKKRARRDLPGFYMGRRIAEVMSWQGADWLFRETRIEEEQPEAMLDALKIPRGATVADVGTGAGYHAIRLARRVGPTGTVFATDLQPEMLQMLRENAEKAGVTNIKPLRATQSETKLPAGAVDLVLMVDVYHECSDPETLLQGLYKALKPHGRLVLVEFRGEDPEVPIKPEHKMTREQVRREIVPQGFIFQKPLEFLPWQHIFIFEKPGDDAPDHKSQNAKQ
jgi:ubiquinone/menaquinone biosynthesis C-methylase UbiE